MRVGGGGGAGTLKWGKVGSSALTVAPNVAHDILPMSQS